MWFLFLQVQFDVENPLAVQASVSAVISGNLSWSDGAIFSPLKSTQLTGPGGDGNPLFIRPGFVMSTISQVPRNIKIIVI